MDRALGSDLITSIIKWECKPPFGRLAPSRLGTYSLIHETQVSIICWVGVNAARIVRLITVSVIVLSLAVLGPATVSFIKKQISD